MRSHRLLATLTTDAVLLAGAAAPSAAASAQRVSALTLLGQLAVVKEQNSGYDRAKFKHWVDANRDGQNTRAEVLISESRKKVTFTTTARRTVKSGKWFSAYDGRTYTAASSVDIDHFVSCRV